ncbi:Hypothetical predicted protein, partial [Pelobates cultripes]
YFSLTPNSHGRSQIANGTKAFPNPYYYLSAHIMQLYVIVTFESTCKTVAQYPPSQRGEHN